MGSKVHYTRETIIERFRKVHGDTYNYDKMVFINATTKVEIVCQKHGSFWQTPANHARPQGCQICRKEKPSPLTLNTETFISQARSKHGDKYDYSKSRYVQARERLTITCRKHGDFLCTPDNHKRGKGCPSCGDERAAEKRVITKEQFVSRAIAKYGDLYCYDEVCYQGYEEKITLHCMIHGDFEIAPTVLINTTTHCPSCGLETGAKKRSYSSEELIERARLVHGDKYEYPSDMFGIVGKQPIVCKEHGVFYQDLHSHINGKSGCPACAAKTCGFRQNKRGFIYLLENEDCVKVGITNRTVKWRTGKINQHHPQNKFVPLLSAEGHGYDCMLAEESLLNFLGDNYQLKYAAPVDGYTEIFAVPIDKRHTFRELFKQTIELHNLKEIQ